jgi:hypothetical protein
MSLAIIFTGQIRTLEQTIDYFVENVLNTNNRYISISVFALLEDPHRINTLESENYRKHYSEYFTEKIRPYICLDFLENAPTEKQKKQGGRIIIDWVEKQCPYMKKEKEIILSKMNIPDLTKDYLGNRSGSIVEYLQWNQCIKKCTWLYGKYDKYFRMRCDVKIKTRFLVRNLIFISEEEKKARLQYLQQLDLTLIANPKERDIYRLYWITIVDEIPFNSDHRIYDNLVSELVWRPPASPEKHLNEYSSNDITWSVREQVLYVSEYLCYFYGKREEIKREKKGEDVWWWNAENQYVLSQKGVLLTSKSVEEEKSLYENGEGKQWQLIRFSPTSP